MKGNDMEFNEMKQLQPTFWEAEEKDMVAVNWPRELTPDSYLGLTEDEQDEFDERVASATVALFRDNGHDVQRDGVLHNLWAWTMDLKSGFADKGEGTFLFTPCGCNPLAFRLDALKPNDKTYAC